MRSKLPLIATMAFVVGAQALSAQNLLVNGGFETGDLTGWTTSPVGNPACQNTFGVTTFAALEGTYGLSGGLPRPECEFNSNTFFTQWIATTPGVAYLVSGAWRKEAGPPRDPCPGYCATYTEVFFGPTLGGGLSSFPVFLNLDAPYGIGATFQFSQVMVATSSLTKFEVELWSQRDYLFVDNLSIVATPEPSTVVLMSSALLVLGAVLRRRARKA